MKATLTIEVPDDFKKGQCWRCRLAQVDFDYDCLSCKVDKWVMHDAYDAYDCDPYQVISSNCPLEIQYNTNEFSEREIELMKQGKVISHRPKENNQ